MIHKNDSQKKFTKITHKNDSKMIQKNDSKKQSTKIIHKNYSKNGSQNWFIKY